MTTDQPSDPFERLRRVEALNRKALELSSPLAPLPANFPNSSERVTAAFYYNLEPPKK